MAIEIIPDRICPHCGGNKYYTYFYKKQNYIQYKCTLLIIEKQERYKQSMLLKNPELFKQRRKKTYKKWCDKNLKEYYTLNKEKWNEKLKSQRDNLSNWYLKALLYDDPAFNSLEITPTLINLKKQSLCLYRKRKELLKQKM